VKHRVFLGLLAFGLLALQACHVTYIVQTAPQRPVPVDPYPNATHIRNRVNEQLSRINLAKQQGSLDNETAFLLSQNDELVNRYASEDRAPSNQTMDLSYQQTQDLDNMLNDNAAMIQDAIQNRQAWNEYFQGSGFDYASSGNSYIYLTYIDHQLSLQLGSVDSGLKSNRLSAADAQEIRIRIQNIQTAKRNYYRQNGRFDLSEAQVGQLSQMADDNDRYLRYRLQGKRGGWDKQKFSGWKSQRPQGLGADADRGNHWGRSKNGRLPVNAAPQPTQVVVAQPTPAATGVAAPQPTPARVNSLRNLRERLNAARNPAPVPTAVPVAAAPAPTAVPTIAPAPKHDNGVGPGGPGPGGPSAAANLAAALAAQNARNKAAADARAKAEPTPAPAAAEPAATSVKLLPPGQVVSFLKRADQGARKASGLSESQASELDQKLAALHQQANDFMKQNQSNSVTQDQMNQLAGMASDISQFIDDAAPEGDSQNSGKGHGKGKNKE
jgi:hypothetical protein